MAFVVCYSQCLEDHIKRPAIYLEQTFYSLIFRVCRSDVSTFPLFSEMASLRYKSPTIIIPSSRLPSLHDELDALGTLGHAHPQISALSDVVSRAVAESCSLTVSGDMYPELPL